MLNIPERMLLCRVTSTGSAATIRQLLPAGIRDDLGNDRVVQVDLKPATAALDVRSDPAVPGDSVASGGGDSYCGTNVLDLTLIGATVVYVKLYVRNDG